MNLFDKRFEIPPMTVGDRTAVMVTQINVAARARARRIYCVDKLAVYFVLSNREFDTPRQITEFIKPAVGLMPTGETVFRYSYLFAQDDLRNQEYWITRETVFDALKNTNLKLV